MNQKVDPNKLLELSGRMKQLNSRMEVQTLGLVQDIMRMVEQTRREYPELYVQSAARQVEIQLQEIRKITAALDGRQKKMIWNLQQTAGQYQQLEKELAQQLKKNLPRVPDEFTSKYAKDIQAIEASPMPEPMKKRLVDQILAFEQKQYEASPKSREEAILQAQKLHHARMSVSDPRIEQAIAGLTFASEAEKRDIVHALETWLKFEASKTTKLTLDEIAKQFREIMPEYPFVLGETGLFHPGDDRSYFILNEFGTNLRLNDKENYRLLEKDYALIEAILINQTHARPAQLPQPDPDVFVSFIIGFAEGVGSVVTDVVDLAVIIYEDPIGTLESVKDGVVQIVINAYDEVNKLIDDPQKYLIEKWGSLERAYEEFMSLSPEEKAKFIGNIAGHAFTYAIPVGGEIKVVVKGAVEAAQIGRAVKKIESVFEKFKNSPAGQLLADERGSINFHSPEKGKPPHTERLPENKNALDNGGPPKAPTKVNYGDHYTIIGRKKVLKPDVEYTSKEGYNYRTDSQGRVSNVEGELKLGVGKRNTYAQKVAGREDRLLDDEGGHLIASIFKGSGELDNLVPMNGNLNKGEWKKLENMWADALKQGDEVKVKIIPNYKGNSQRPDSFDIKFKIGEDDWEFRRFDNVPGGKLDE